jgi:pimeloyl-ACP methyl ester carboxylesterase
MGDQSGSGAPTAFRTPDERFSALPDFPWEPHYREWRGLRLAHLDEGEGSPVVMLHGEPTWSFLYRKVMRVLIDAGHRSVVATRRPIGPPQSWTTMVTSRRSSCSRSDATAAGWLS